MYKFAVTKDNIGVDYKNWITAIEEYPENISYDVVDITDSQWLGNLTDKKYDAILVRPPSMSMRLKSLYDERLYILSEVLGKTIYPDYKSIYVYENKRLLSYLLKAKEIPHPKSWVFYNKKEAFTFLEETSYPIVSKINIGAAGLGVKIFKNKDAAHSYVKKAFNGGVRSKTGPDTRKPDLVKRIINALTDISYLKRKINNYRITMKEKQVGFVFLQEYIPHEFEWRCVRIGDSFFAHKKIKVNDKASGYLEKKYDTPPEKLLNLIKNVSEELEIYSAAYDVFENGDGEYLVNEVQAIFGQKGDHLMLLNEIPGRYLFKNRKWLFEEGSFNDNKSNSLRLGHLFSILGKRQ